MGEKHYVIIIPGLGDAVNATGMAVSHWKWCGLTPFVVGVAWRDGKDFESKLNNLVEMVDKLATKGKVSIVGTSAGGSAALNTFWERRNKVYRVVNVCGRLRVGTFIGIHSFRARTATSLAFAQSVKKWEEHEKSLSKDDKLKILTIHALFGDELVPTNTTMIEGVRNIVVPTPEHMLSITMALTLWSRPLIRFLLEP